MKYDQHQQLSFKYSNFLTNNIEAEANLEREIFASGADIEQKRNS